MPPPNASDVDWTDLSVAALARFGRELGQLIDLQNDTVLVAVSGGPDSMALLLLTHAVLRDRCVAATVDHGLRKASAEEADHVAAICAERGIAHYVLKGDMPARAGKTANLSTRARLLRYRLLEDMLAAHKLRWLATAHHADDQLETFVMRANRSAGVGGLAGARRRGSHIIRPLLRWRRTDLAELVAREGVATIDDPTNSDARFDRARLRKVLADVDWLDPLRISESMIALASADDALTWSARRVYDERVACRSGGRTFSPCDVPVEIVRRVIVRCLVEIDPRCEADGPGLTRVATALAQGRSAMLGDVLVTVSRDRDGGPRWTFSPAPPRRSH